PGAQRRVEAGIEIGVAAAREGVLLPDDLARDGRLGVRAEPVERIGEPAYAVLGDDRLRGVAGAAAGEEGHDAGAAALLLVAFPHRAEGQRRAERPRPSR